MTLLKGIGLAGKVISQITLPPGCIGIMLVFDSKKSAKAYDHKAQLIEIEPAK